MKYFFIKLCFALPGLAFSQKVAMFQATLYFEDQSGWTDSIRIGYDTSANNLFNPEFGEFNIGQSFDPVFEVRASHRNAAPLAEEGAILSKTIIGHAELEVMEPPVKTCFIGQTIVLYIKAKYPPVRIHWDWQAFQNPDHCNPGCFLTPDFLYDISDPLSLWIKLANKRFACLPKQEFFDVNLDPQYTMYNFPLEITHRLIRSFTDGVKDTLFGVALHFIPLESESPCSLEVGAQQTETSDEEIQLYPNPAHQILRINGLDWKRVSSIECVRSDGLSQGVLYDIGEEASAASLSVEDGPVGLYFLILRFLDGKIERKPFFKL